MIISIKNYLRRASFALFILIFSFLNSSPVFAAGSSNSGTTGAANGFSISPVISNLTIQPGNSYTLDIYLQNPTHETLVAQPVINDFEASSNESGTPKLLLNNKNLPTNNFEALVGSVQTVTLAAGQQKVVPVTITIPKNANPGGYYGVVRFIPTQVSNQANIGLTASVGTLVLVTVPGNLIQKLNLVQLATLNGNSVSSFFTSGEPNVLVRLNNSGNIQVTPSGTLVLMNMFGHVISKISFNTTGGQILPSSIRKWISSLPNQKYLGPYSVEANINYGNNGAVLTAKTTFWYLPAWLIVVIVLAIIVLIGIVYWLLLTFHSKSAIRKHRKNAEK